jgi:hypothetical protein
MGIGLLLVSCSPSSIGELEQKQEHAAATETDKESSGANQVDESAIAPSRITGTFLVQCDEPRIVDFTAIVQCRLMDDQGRPPAPSEVFIWGYHHPDRSGTAQKIQFSPHGTAATYTFHAATRQELDQLFAETKITVSTTDGQQIEGTLKEFSKPLPNPGVDTQLQPVAPSQPLNLTARRRWDNNNGYSGEVSIQTVALYYGAWISQKTIRDSVGSELLPGANMEAALTALRFKFESMGGSFQQQASFTTFMTWMKGQLISGSPVIFTTYISGGKDPDYDDILPAFGVKEAAPGTPGYHGSDVLYYFNNFEQKTITHSFASLEGTRSSCSQSASAGGCISSSGARGIAIKGILDEGQVTLPVQLSVDSWSEPNVSLGESPGQMQGKVSISGLTAGKKYALLRFNHYPSLPVSGTAADFLAATPFSRFDFTAEAEQYVYNDPQPIQSNGSVYYRVVPLP